MSNVKSMMDEVKRHLRLVRTLLLVYCCKLLRGAVRVLLVCCKLVLLMLALPLIAPQLFQDVTEELATKEEQP